MGKGSAEHLIIRDFRIEDAPDIMRYFNQGLKENKYPFVFPFRSSRITLREINKIWIPGYRRGDTITTVAELDGKVIGAGTLFRPRNPTETGWEYTVTVSPDHIGKGIGKLITRRILRVAKMKGVKKVMGKVIPENVATMRMNKKMGFHVEGRLRKHFYYKRRYYDLVVWAFFP